MATFEARLGMSGFLGKVEVVSRAGMVGITGRRAAHAVVVARASGQWLIAAAGLVALLARSPWSMLLLPAAALYSWVMYLTAFGLAHEQTVEVVPGQRTEATQLWPLVWQNAFAFYGWEVAAFTAASKSSQPGRSVAFRGPSQVRGGRDVRYVLVEQQPGDGSALVASLLGADAVSDAALAGRTSAST